MARSATKIANSEFDIVIAGAGYVGVSCAAAIKTSAPQLEILIVDPAPEEAIENEERASAIAADALLEVEL